MLQGHPIYVKKTKFIRILFKVIKFMFQKPAESSLKDYIGSLAQEYAASDGFGYFPI